MGEWLDVLPKVIEGSALGLFLWLVLRWALNHLSLEIRALRRDVRCLDATIHDLMALMVRIDARALGLNGASESDKQKELSKQLSWIIETLERRSRNLRYGDEEGSNGGQGD